MSRDREDKQTVEMCYHKGENRDPCTNAPQWKLKNAEKGYRFKVCDAHLAWCIRFCGYPAIVDAYEPDSKRPPTSEYKVVSDAAK